MKKYLLIVFFLLLSFFFLKKVNENFTVDDSTLIVIIPVRDREQQLKEYLQHMIPIFKYQKIDYKIYIVEQVSGKLFNKAKISNVGFLESSKENKDIERYLFNDVDNYPLKKQTVKYKTDLRYIHHLYGHLHCLGGFFTISKKNFKKMNGYSNDFWGWGGEDIDLKHRAMVHNIDINRNTFIKRTFDNSRNRLIKDPFGDRIKNENYKDTCSVKKKYYLKDKNNVYHDGLTTCNYTILKKKVSKDNKITHLLLDI